MAMTSMRHQDHEGIHRDDELNTSQEPFDLHQADWEPLTTTTSSTSPVAWIGYNVVPVPLIEVDLNNYLPLYQAALNGDWESASRFIDRDPNALTARISTFSMTALHVAVSEGRSQFVEKLVELMSTEALEMQDSRGRTALHYAAVGGSTDAAKAMVGKNHALTQIMDMEGLTPIILATLGNSKEMLWYLSLVTRDEPPSSPFTGPSAGRLIFNVTEAGFHDVALYLLQHYPNLASARDGANSLLSVLARKPSAFPSGSGLGFWSSCIYLFVPKILNYAPPHLLRGDMEDPLQNSGDLAEVPPSIRSGTYLTLVLQWFNRLLWKAIELAPGTKQVREEKLRHKQALKLVKHICGQVAQMNNSQIIEFFKEQAILTTATSHGIVEIVVVCLQLFPDLIWLTINHQTILHVAIEYRRERIFNLLQKMTGRIKFLASWLDKSNNNILHLTAKLPPSQLKSRSRAALYMQSELLWFKEVGKFVSPSYKEMRNNNMRTAWEVFMEEHKEVVEKAQNRLKDTSNSCMVAATLIATVVFAAAFTVPGGNNSENGVPILIKRNSFLVFIIADALALLSSSISLIMFLLMIPARYAEEDFLEVLPRRLIIGFASLFFAIATMMIAFSATLAIVLGERWEWVSIPIALVASFPVVLFAVPDLPEFIRMVLSTFPYLASVIDKVTYFKL